MDGFGRTFPLVFDAGGARRPACTAFASHLACVQSQMTRCLRCARHHSVPMQDAVATLERQAVDQQSAAQKEAASSGAEINCLAASLDKEQAQARSLREQLTSVAGAADAERASAAHAQRALQQVGAITQHILWQCPQTIFLRTFPCDAPWVKSPLVMM